MFGYITVCKPELKIKDFYKYQSYYCGLCHTLKERFGLRGQMTLSYDMTFVAILLTSLYESETTFTTHHCIVHPVKKRGFSQNEMSAYAADMNILLTYYKFLDDWEDEKKKVALAASKLLKEKAKKVIKQYPRQSKAIRDCLKELAAYEASNETNLDLVSGCFGHLMEELFIYKQDEWEQDLRRFGFFLGKFIYLMDAYDDLQEDLKKGGYNPLISLYNEEAYEEKCRQILTMMMSECSMAFERLPCLVDADILRNVLYAGVWTKYNQIQEKQKEEKEQKNDK